MSITTGGVEQLHGHTLDADSGALAALAVSADDLPELDWKTDEPASTRFVVVRVGGDEFALESEDASPEKQTTVYGRQAGEALDQLIEALGLDDSIVLDRVDRPSRHHAAAATVLQTAAASAAAAVAALQARLEDRMEEIEAQMEREAREAEERKAAVAILELRGDALTERERLTLHLVSAGWTADEIAELLGITRPTVLKYIREATRRQQNSGTTARKSDLEQRDASKLTKLVATGKFTSSSVKESGRSRRYIKGSSRARSSPASRRRSSSS